MRRAIAITTSERYFALIANFATIAAVSRILRPAEIGVSVIGLAVAGLALALREFATTNFVVQKKDLKIEDVRTAFTVLLLLTFAIAAAMCAGALALSDFYDQRSLVPFIRVVALCLASQRGFRTGGCTPAPAYGVRTACCPQRDSISSQRDNNDFSSISWLQLYVFRLGMACFRVRCRCHVGGSLR